jgi:hypothetical protein
VSAVSRRPRSSRADGVALPRQQARYLDCAERIERLNSDIPARLRPRPGRMLDRRANLELRLKRSLIVERRAAIEQFENDVGKP